MKHVFTVILERLGLIQPLLRGAELTRVARHFSIVAYDQDISNENLPEYVRMWGYSERNVNLIMGEISRCVV